MHALYVVCMHLCYGLLPTQPPIERVLGEDFRLAPSGAMREVKDCFYYVPLLSSLQAMLNFKEIRDQVQ